MFNDKDIERLEKVKQLLLDIKEIDWEFKLNNVIEVNDKTTLVFTTDLLLKDADLDKYEDMLTDKLQCKSIILHNRFKLDKAVEKENKQIDFETITFYADGEVIRQKTVQYK